MNKDLKKILFIIVASFIVIISLYAFSVRDVLITKNGFERKFDLKINNPIKYPLPFKALKIIEVEDNGLYLLNENATEILFFDLKTKTVDTLITSKLIRKKIGIPMIHKASLTKNHLFILSPQTKKIYSFPLNENWPIKNFKEIEIKYGADRMMILNSGFLIKGRDSINRARYYFMDELGREQNFQGVVEKTREAVIADDGFFVKGINYFVYIKYLKNEFQLLDDSGKPIKTYKTISKSDYVPKIKKSEKSVALAGHVIQANLRADIDHGKLYIESGIKADNANPFRFKFNSIIDVYSLDTGEYLKSFYIPSYSGIKMNSFKVKNNKLFSVHGNYLLIYILNEKENHN